ncbi:pentapeptide repeat-containing protein [bacterium]|nr:pentapeptide repeat-containing protein [bacterium]
MFNLAYRIDTADGVSRNGFRWPDSGPVEAPGPFNATNSGPCPSRPGDGICAATTWEGAASGGHDAGVVRLVAYDDADVLGWDRNKVRLARAHVVGTIPVRDLATPGADLAGAYLYRADLRGADLRGAYLWRAHLRGADLRGADLTGADLRGALLTDANLRGADLLGALLTGADLTRANLRGADLTDADLTRARVEGATLPS